MDSKSVPEIREWQVSKRSWGLKSVSWHLSLVCHLAIRGPPQVSRFLYSCSGRIVLEQKKLCL